MKRAMVTGATGAIGEAIATAIAAAGHEVVLACRDVDKARRVRDRIVTATGNEGLSIEIVDVARPGAIRALAERLDGPLHVLVNNAADTPRRRTETPERIETQLATNVLGYFWMTRALRAALRDGAPSRVVNVASYWAGGLDLDDLQFERRRYDADAAYRQSKQADRMLTVALADRLASDGITVNACHPGDVRSKLSTSLGFGGHETPDEGAVTPVFLATSADVEGVTGRYFERGAERACPFGADEEAVDVLFDLCDAFPGPT